MGNRGFRYESIKTSLFDLVWPHIIDAILAGNYPDCIVNSKDEIHKYSSIYSQTDKYGREVVYGFFYTREAVYILNIYPVYTPTYDCHLELSYTTSVNKVEDIV